MRFNATAKAALVVLCLSMLAGADVSVQSSVYYVRAGATGANTGADWTNAFSALPATLSRGATYYVADGSYSSYTFDDAASADALITIRKATAADHGTSAGWQAAFGDGVATFGRWDFASSNWVVDGNTSTWSYGFIVSGGCGGPMECIDIGDGTSASITNVLIRSASANPGGECNIRGIKINGASDLTLDNVEIWNSDNDAISMDGNSTGVTFDRVYIHTRNNAGCGTHGDAFELWGGGNNTIRNSRVAWDGQQVFWGGGFTHGRWDIYGNVFYGGATSGQGLKAHSSDPVLGPIYAYNNTFYNVNISIQLGSNTTGVMQNNLFFRSGNPAFGRTTHDYNWFEDGMTGAGERNAKFGSNPFVNAAGEDFRLSTATGPGAPLAEIYAIDPMGATRGLDGMWDRGAFEYGASSAGGSPAAPTSLRITSE